MDNKEQREDKLLSKPAGSRIELVVNQPGGENAVEINLVRVFRNMKRKKRIFVWVILLFFAAGICAPLLLFQLTQKPLTVSSVVTLDYDVLRRSPTGQILSAAPVTDLTAPDGEPLDLNQLTSSYVLQNALEGLELSHPLSLENLRRNLRIDRILTEESRQQQEIASRMISDKNNSAYAEVLNIQLTYINQFVVSLSNGFGNPDSRFRFRLTDSELRLVLERILYAYNDYLAASYADAKLPDDEFSAIDIERQDLLESLDQLRAAVQNLYDFCDLQPDAIKSYRSWNTGSSLSDLMAVLETVRTVNVNYLYSYVSTNSIVRDRDSMIINYQYQLRSAQNQLDELNERIGTMQDILNNYKNDEIFVSMQDSDTSRSTRTTTDYYNRLIMEQADNYERAAKLEEQIADLQYKLDSLSAAEEDDAAFSQEETAAELADALAVCRRAYELIRDQLEEIHGSAFFTTYAEHTIAQGSAESFLLASARKMAVGGAAGAVIACGLWFLSAMAMEFRVRKEEAGRGKEAAKE